MVLKLDGVDVLEFLKNYAVKKCGVHIGGGVFATCGYVWILYVTCGIETSDTAINCVIRVAHTCTLWSMLDNA